MSQIQLHAVQTRAQRQRLVPERISIKVFCTPAVKKTWLETHTAAQHRGKQVGAVAYRCSLSHSSCWSYSEESASEGQRAEAQQRRNRMEHEVIFKASGPTATPTEGPAKCLWGNIKSTQDEYGWGGVGGVRGGGVGCWGRWLIWISSFLSFVYVVMLSSSAMLK